MEDFQIIDNCLMVRMPEEVDHHRASYICEGADRLLVRENVENVVFDFEDTRFMDSSGIGIIMGRYRKISCFGGHVYAIHADRQIQRIAAGLQRRFAAEALIDHAAQRQQHQAFIPARRQDRHSQQIAQHIVDHDIHGERE